MERFLPVAEFHSLRTITTSSDKLLFRNYSLEPTLTEILSAHSALPAIGSTWGLSPPARCSLCATPTSNLTNTKKQEPPAST